VSRGEGTCILVRNSKTPPIFGLVQVLLYICCSVCVQSKDVT